MKTQPLPSAEAGPSDEELMQELARKTPGALQPLFARYAPLVFHIASQSLDPGSAEDIVQDVFLAVWRKADTFDPGRGALRPWLLQIAHYRILNELRARSRRPQLDPDVAADVVDGLPDTTAEPRGSCLAGVQAGSRPRGGRTAAAPTTPGFEPCVFR